MTKPDDNLLTEEQLRNVRRHADRLMRNASAYGRFPTPIDDILSAAKLTVVEDEVLNESALRRFFTKAKASFATLKSAVSKVLGLLEVNDRLVVIDKDCPAPRVPFIKLHEAGHTMPHQRDLFALIHDCEKTIDPDITDLFEREANVFASEALFQGEIFATEAHDLAFGTHTAIDLAKKYGASNYSTFRRYVTTNPQCCCLIVLEQPIWNPSTGMRAEVRRVVASKTFDALYDAHSLTVAITKDHPLKSLVPFGKQRIVKPQNVGLTDRNGTLRECIGESFNTRKQVLVLIRDTGPLTTIILPPRKRVLVAPR